MDYKLTDLIDIPLFQTLQDKLNEIYSFPSAIIDNDGVILTATAWQDICTKFHRVHPECEKECQASDQYIMGHLHEAKPAVTYRCPHGLVDNATPIVIGGKHLGNYFTGQFFLEEPDLEFFKSQAKKYGFDETAYLAAVRKVPVWSNEKLRQYLDFIKGFTEILAGIGYKHLQEIEARLLVAEKGQALEDMSVLNEQIVESVDEGIVVYGPDLRYRLWNPYMEKLSGRPASEVIGRLPTEVFPALMDLGLFDRIVAALRGESQPPFDFPFTTPFGRSGWTSDTTAPLYGSNKEIIGAIATVRDITERKRAEAERLKLQEELLQSQKMESVGRLAGGVAHDFNNMLGVILGSVETALEQSGVTDPVRAELREIQKSAERSADLTRQLLAFARKQTIAPKVIDLNATVEGMLRMIRRLIGEDIELVWTPGGDLGWVKIDPSQLDQILANLCVNARDAIQGNGKIAIRTQNVACDERFRAEHPDHARGPHVRLEVSDTGCGISAEARAHIFEPFFTTKQIGQGTGLGLATVYGIATQNNGFVSVRSEPGQGSTFAVYLPRHEATIVAQEPGRDAKQESAAAQDKVTILLVEDEPANLKVATCTLERLGYVVLAAGAPSQAIQLAELHKGRIDLLITDVVMPEMNGRELALRLQERHHGLRQLFISGYTSDIIANHGVLDEGVNFLQKPFTREQLKSAIRKAMDSPRRADPKTGA